MSTTICLYNYEYQGQVLSPAFSDPPSPVRDDDLVHCPTSDDDEEVSRNGSKRRRRTSTSSGSEAEDCGEANVFRNKKPRFPTKYHERLQPLSPSTVLPVRCTVLTRVPPPGCDAGAEVTVPAPCKAAVDAEAQAEFVRLLDAAVADANRSGSDAASSPRDDVEAFLSGDRGRLVDVNAYDVDGQTPFLRCCQEGDVALLKVLVAHGANIRLTTREGFSALHIAAFSGNSDLVFYVMSLKSE